MNGWVRRCLLALCALPLLAGCGGSGPGGIRGTVTYAGPDTDQPISMQGDPACAGLYPEPVDSEEIILKDGKLANVFVYVKSGLEGKSFPVPAEKRHLDQRGCLFGPHVLGVQVGQTVELANSDMTLHTVHALPASNAESNDPQPQGTPPIDRRFDKPEVMVPLRCDIHPWMVAYVGVVPHPYYAVSGEDGAFSIAKLPPGKYTLEAWHEKLGTQTRQVTVAPGRAATVDFDFKPKP
ncbi:MAG TPA: carboxypeptidase regulatory-like domain-containing protein [Thermoanaerobaculia bacterium]|jgi:plastocyanin|nr:carboxypeptidase regulatory-like domain-containing protein [Thermoanaerobaculia bacterium]